MKTLIRAAENKQRGRMRTTGRQFDMPALERHVLFEWAQSLILKLVYNSLLNRQKMK